jgi:N-acetylglucosamine-6-sulfatase
MLLLMLAAVALTTPMPSAREHPDVHVTHAQAPARPSIVVIVTDDQPDRTLRYMPIVRRRLSSRGTVFENAFVVNPTCCPSRTSLLTGLYSHSTGVYGNSPPHGGWSAFDDRSTLPVWLRRAGYHTAMFGKYLNGYTTERASYVPPGWDRWYVFADTGNGAYYDYALSIDGETVERGSSARDYSTHLLGRRTAGFIRSTRGPLFVLFAPYAPHAPYTPPPGTRPPSLRPSRPPSYNEASVRDKPRWVRRHARLKAPERRGIDRRARLQVAALRGVDGAVGRIVAALRDTNRLARTMIVFASDNGLAWGQHRLRGKDNPYDESIGVPLIIRYDEWARARRRVRRPVLNIDLAPTFLQLTHADAPAVEGRSLVPLLSGRRAPRRGAFVVEHMRARFGIPAYCALRSRRYKYVSYDTGERELYDLKRDPHELRNVAAAPGRRKLLARLRDRLVRLCNPPPPGLRLPP